MFLARLDDKEAKHLQADKNCVRIAELDEIAIVNLFGRFEL
jgi:hypothetical protein